MSEPTFAKRLDAHLAGFTSLGFTTADDLFAEDLADTSPIVTPAQRSFVMEFAAATIDPDALALMFGAHRRPGHAITIDSATTVPDLPPPPRKGRRLQGKRYRIARRAYGRAVRAWRRAGRPTRTTPHRVHIPRASVAHDGPDSYSITPLPAYRPEFPRQELDS